MSLPLILVAAIALLLLAVAARLLWARSRRIPDTPVTEAQARAHALPLSTSILSVGPRHRDRGRADLDA